MDAGSSGMGNKLLSKSTTIIIAAITGATGGLVVGGVSSVVFSFILLATTSTESRYWAWLILTNAQPGGVIGAVIGMILGVSTSLLGIRSDIGYDWAITAGFGSGLGAWLMEVTWSGVPFIGGIGFVVGIVDVLLLRRVLGNKIYRDPISKTALAGYLTIGVLIAGATSMVIGSLR
jgi:hypothetical protein